MQGFFEEVELGLNHVQVMVQGMYAVAQCDGVHDAELVLLEAFYKDCQKEGEGLADFSDVIGVPFDPEAAKDILDTAKLRHAFLTSCLLLAYADGDFSAAERTKIAQLADALGIASDEQAELEERVRDHLLQQVASIENVEALRTLVREMRSS